MEAASLANDHGRVLRRAHGFPLPHRSAGVEPEGGSLPGTCEPLPTALEACPCWGPSRDHLRSTCPPTSMHTSLSLSLQSWNPRPARLCPSQHASEARSLCGGPRQQAGMSGPVHAAPAPPVQLSLAKRSLLQSHVGRA